MEIKKDLPFESCENCCECILDVNEQTLFAYGQSCQKVIRIGCKNEKLCKRLKEKMKNEHGTAN